MKQIGRFGGIAVYYWASVPKNTIVLLNRFELSKQIPINKQLFNGCKLALVASEFSLEGMPSQMVVDLIYRIREAISHVGNPDEFNI